MSRGNCRQRDGMACKPLIIAIAALLGSTYPALPLAAQQGAAKPAMNSWLLCLQGNSLSAVEVTPEHAVDIAYSACSNQESAAIREQFPELVSNPTSMDMIRSKVRNGIRASLIKVVVDDRASDPELHSQFADKVREDEQRQSSDVASLVDRASGPCQSFRASALTAPNQVSTLVKAASSPGLVTSLAGSLGPFKIDFAKDEFISTETYNEQRQSKWIQILSGGKNLVLRKTIDTYDIIYDADRGIIKVRIGSPVFDQFRQNLDGVNITIDYKILRQKEQFRGGISESVELEVPSSSLKGETQLSSRTIEIPMSPDRARKLKASAVLALQITSPIADDQDAIVLLNDITKYGEAFKGDPRGSIHNKKSYPVRVSCAAIFSGNEYIIDALQGR
jgi:hypothetical protein